MSKKPKVSICCVTYNHENFIKQTLDGFVMQKTDFPFEVLIHDDASTDKTAQIIKKYEEKYPHIIKGIYQQENQFSKGVPVIIKFVFPKVQGEYVAICEGDDYWTDENKLQKQVDFLDSNPECSICFHPVVVKFEDKSYPDSLYPNINIHEKINGNILPVEYLLFGNLIQTNSVMYRWRFKTTEEMESLFTIDVLPSDWFLHLLHAQVGKVGFIKDVMAVYRRHKDGIWWNSTNHIEKIHLFYGVRELKLFLKIQEMFPQYNVLNGQTYINNFALAMFKIYLKHKRFNEMQEIIKLCPTFFKLAKHNNLV